MANLIKNQILKHLSKFAKNLSHDQINLSTLKGEGELRNLELNEEVLTDLLELPSWLRLRSANCNRVTIRIPWTKLKSVPINLSLDEVKVEVETCETLRTTMATPKKAQAQSGHYGFADKVVDGVSVTVNSVILTMHSRVFTASFQMSRISVDSMTPNWTKADLRMTRIKETDKQEVLIFKELSWQTVRIEAKSTVNDDLTPLRLITNQARCRLTIKKKMTDCSVLGCRLVLILDDLLWVLTDDQLKAALHFADSLSGLLKRATEETQKIKGARKLESMAETIKAKDSVSKKKASSQQCPTAKVFARYDVVETSYHFYSDRIDLHLCDDPGGRGRSCHPQLSEGGAFQISLSKLQVDFYPYHLALSNRTAWIRYQESVHATWLDNSINAFKNELLDALAFGKNHSKLARATHQGQTSSAANGDIRGGASTPGAELRDMVLSQFKMMLTSNLVVRLSNFSCWKVSTSKEKSSPQEFISGIDKPRLSLKARKKDAGERDKFSLPQDMPVIHFEYTQFFYPGGLDFAVPPPKLFAYINPIQINIDPLTILWLNAFALNLEQSVKMLSLEKGEPPYLDVKVEAIMIRLIVESDRPMDLRQKDRPQALHVQVSRVLASNYRSIETGSKADLAGVLERFQKSELFFGSDFPCYPNDIPTVCEKMVQHATSQDDVGSAVDSNELLKSLQSNNRQEMWKFMKKKLLWTEAKDVWYVLLDPVWADFHGTPSSGSRPIPLVDALPVSLWIYKQPEEEDEEGVTNAKPKSDEDKVQAKIHIMGSVNSLLSIQLNHYQLLFLLRTIEMISEITTFLHQDLSHILGEMDEGSVAVGLVAPQVDLSLLMPAATQIRDSLGGDFDSYAPDTSSIYSGAEIFQKEQQQQARRASPYSIDEEMGSENQLSTGDNSTIKSQSQSDIDKSSSAPESPDQSDIDQAVAQFQKQQQQQLPPDQAPDQPRSVPVTPRQAKPKVPAIHLQGSNHSPAMAKRNSLASSLTNMMASLDTSLRGDSTPQGGSSSKSLRQQVEDDSVSIRSDGSSDSENYVLINRSDSFSARELIDASLFGVGRPRGASPSGSVEFAVEVTEETMSSCSSTHTPKYVAPERPASIIQPVEREGMISVATFHLGRLELAQQSVGRHACIKLQAASLSSSECPSISWEEFQSKFSTRGKGWSESTLQPQSSWCCKLRLSTNAPNFEDIQNHQSTDTDLSLREKIARSADAFLELRIQNLPLQFYLSTLNGLGDLFEDELIPTPIPMRIRVENIALHLIEDRPSPNITSPGHLPVDVAVPSLTITRDRSGLFSIQPLEIPSPDPNLATSSVSTSSAPDGKASKPTMTHHLDLVRSGVASLETELHQRADLLAVDNSHLRSLLDASTAEVEHLRKKVEEGETAARKCTKLQDKMSILERENKSLKETLKYLQEELIKAGKKV